MQLAEEDAGRLHHHPRVPARLAVEADVIAERAAQIRAVLVRHPAGGGAGGHPPRFEHHDPTGPLREGAQDGRRHAGGLTGPGGGAEHHRPGLSQSGDEGGQGGVDGQRGRGHVGRTAGARHSGGQPSGNSPYTAA